MVGDVEHRTEVGVSEHRPLGLAGSAAGILQYCDPVLELTVWVAVKRAVIVDKRGKFDLTTGSSDAIRCWSKGERDRRRQKVLDAADHQRLELGGAFQRSDLRIKYR